MRLYYNVVKSRSWIQSVFALLHHENKNTVEITTTGLLLGRGFLICETLLPCSKISMFDSVCFRPDARRQSTQNEENWRMPGVSPRTSSANLVWCEVTDLLILCPIVVLVTRRFKTQRMCIVVWLIGNSCHCGRCLVRTTERCQST